MSTPSDTGHFRPSLATATTDKEQARRRFGQAWHERANLLRLPDVLLTPGTKHAWVRLDLCQAGTRLPESVVAWLRRVLGAWESSPTSSYIMCKRVPLESAEEIARLLVDTALEHARGYAS